MFSRIAARCGAYRDTRASKRPWKLRHGGARARGTVIEMKEMRDGSRFRGPVIALALVGAVPFAPAARAESADALLRRGIELRKAGRDVEAIAVFKELIKIDASPRSIEIGRAHV